MTTYNWKINGLAKKINPDDAVQELERIRIKYGALKAIHVVTESKDPTAVLHNYFEWNNVKAAMRFRLDQAQRLINNIEITVISEGEHYTIGAFEIVDDNGYSNVRSFSVNDMETVRRSVITELKYLEKKLSAYTDFVQAKGFVVEAIKILTT